MMQSSRRILLAGLVLCIFSALEVSAEVPGGDPAALVEIRVNDFDPSLGEVTYTLVAKATAPVCATVVEATFWWPDGHEEVVSTLTDTYREEQCLNIGETETVSVSMTRPEYAESDIKDVQIIAVVDYRHRGYGDRDAIRQIRQERIAERLLLRRLESHLHQARARGQSLARTLAEIRTNQGLALTLPSEIPIEMGRGRLNHLLTILQNTMDRAEMKGVSGMDAVSGKIRTLSRPIEAEQVTYSTERGE